MQRTNSLKDMIGSKDYWEKARDNPQYAEVIERIKRAYDEGKETVFESLRYSDRMLFKKQGSRQEFEGPYFRRRQFASAAALLSMFYPENEEYLRELQDILWAICEEYSWVLPAHCERITNADTQIDLFAAETASMISEICFFAEDKLEDTLKDRIRSELDRRIFRSFVENSFYWEHHQDNWLAVCGGNVAIAMAWQNLELLEEQSERIKGILARYLQYIPNDGTCLEGLGYWHYGFGNYLWAADVLYERTNGKIDLFKDPKIKALAGYAQRCFLLGGATVSISDGSDGGVADAAIVSFLHQKFPDTVKLLPSDKMHMGGGNIPWIAYTRTFLYARFDPNATLPQKDYDLPDAGQVIINRENYSLFAKAGHNGEAHNHNDVGSFILANKNGQVLCDLGAPRYVKDYFLAPRYDYLNASSRGHNVPIINGQYQLGGREHCGTIAHEGNTITVEFSKAYEIEGLDRLTRTFTYNDNTITMTDSFDIDVDSYTERFVTKKTPTVYEDYVEVDGVKISFDPALVTPKLSFEKFESHGLARNTEGKEISPDGFELVRVNMIDFELKKGEKSVTFTFTVE